MATNTRTEHLNNWLAEHGARCLWEKKVGRNLVEGWLVDSGRVVIVMRYGQNGEDGWDIFTSYKSTSIKETLADAGERVA